MHRVAVSPLHFQGQTVLLVLVNISRRSVVGVVSPGTFDEEQAHRGRLGLCGDRRSLSAQPRQLPFFFSLLSALPYLFFLPNFFKRWLPLH